MRRAFLCPSLLVPISEPDPTVCSPVPEQSCQTLAGIFPCVPLVTFFVSVNSVTAIVPFLSQHQHGRVFQHLKQSQKLTLGACSSLTSSPIKSLALFVGEQVVLSILWSLCLQANVTVLFQNFGQCGAPRKTKCHFCSILSSQKITTI